jgi:hypothetical protein
VEIQVSFMAIKSNDQYHMKSILRSIALLDDTYTQVRHPTFPYHIDPLTYTRCRVQYFTSSIEIVLKRYTIYFYNTIQESIVKVLN